MSQKPRQKKSLADQLDEFGRTVFGGLLGGNKQKEARRPPSRSTLPKYYPPPGRQSGSQSQRAGSVLSRPPNMPAAVTPPAARVSNSGGRAEAAPGSRPLWRRTAGTTTEPSNNGLARRPSSSPADLREAKTSPKTSPAGLAGLADPGLRPLHERLTAFRHSAFKNTDASPQQPKSESGDAPSSPQPSTKLLVTPTQGAATEILAEPTPASPTAVSTQERAGASSASPMVVAPPKGPAATTHVPSARSSGRPVIAPYSSPMVRTDRVGGGEEPSAERSDGVLFARQSPVLSVETAGPRKISVGKEAAYEVTIRNSAQVAAAEVVVLIDLPEWADVLGAEATTGAAQVASPGGAGEPFQWRVGRLEALGREKIVLKIVPRQSRPFDLAVRWDYKPEASQVMIEVQEPKLVLNLEGPREVLYGAKELFKLNISNTGTGDAENVVITLVPMGESDSQSVSHNLGTIEADQQKTIEVELTARQVGNLMIKVEVHGDAGAYAELSEGVLVRRPAIEVDVQGPKIQYVGSVVGYEIRLSNPGTAPAKDVQVSVNIPPGAKYLSGVDGSRLEANGTKVAWTLNRLDAGAQRSFVIKCSLGLPGLSRMEVGCTAAGELSALASATTRVQSIADLVLEVKDPTGPIPVASETTYELRIRNRGTSAAQNVEVMVYFSHGIEPTKVEGGQHRIGPGQVVFSPIESVAAGAELVLTIRARAESAGNHVFRAEVHCKALGTKLVSEETTYFYQDDPVSQTVVEPPPRDEASPPTGVPGPIPTADRRQSVIAPGALRPVPTLPQGPRATAAPQGSPTPAAPRTRAPSAALLAPPAGAVPLK